MKRLPAVFYALPSGREPVREWLRSLDRDDRKIVGEDIIKKTQETPADAMELALRRKKEIT